MPVRSLDKYISIPPSNIVWKTPIRDFGDEDIKNMATSLQIHGQIQPIVCKPPNREGLYEGVVGRLRYEGTKYARIPEVLVRVHEFKDEDEVLEWQLAENLHRRQLADHQKIETIQKLAELRKKHSPGESVIKGIVTAIQESTGEKKPEGTIKKALSVAQRLKKGVKTVLHRTPEKAGKLKISHLEAICRVEDENLQMELAKKAMSENWSAQKLKREVDKILNPTPPLPEGIFNVIYADPPWRYNVKLRGHPEEYYPTMATEEICNLKFPIADDAVLFLWATNPMLEDALKVMDAWGFKYKTNMVWVKSKFGTGFYFRGQHELLLVGVRGNIHPPEESARPPSVLYADTTRHSEKPEEVYKIIETMYPRAKYLELFARSKKTGWKAWGNEV